MDSGGQIKGSASVISDGYDRTSRMPALKENRQKFIDHYFSSRNPGVKIDSFTIDNEDLDTMPLVQKFNFTQATNASGDYRYFNTNLFSGLEKNPFITDNRFSDIFFGANQRYTILGNFSIPDTYTFEELPKNMRMIMPDTGIIFTRMMVQDENALHIRFTLEFKKPIYSTEEYAAFQEFYKKLYGLLNEQLVIKKIKKL